MYDFVEIEVSKPKKDTYYISPEFMVGPSNDLMIRGGDFYAIWDESTNLWSTDENTAIRNIDKILLEKSSSFKETHADCFVVTNYMRRSSSGSIDKWHKFVQKQMRDNFKKLDGHIVYSNDETTKLDYATKKLPYNFGEGTTDSFNTLINKLYSESERKKIKWLIGCIASGDSKKLQKFFIFYGAQGTGKSTMLNIIQSLFDGYWSACHGQSVVSGKDSFALEDFKDNPLLGIDHEVKLSKIEDNTLLNSLSAHEMMSINEKHKNKYKAKFDTLLIFGSNEMVQITDAKSGLIRRLIDIQPTGELFSEEEYDHLFNDIVNNERGAIVKECLELYNKLGRNYYNKYRSDLMIQGTNYFYNFIADRYFDFVEHDPISLKVAWAWYLEDSEKSNNKYTMTRLQFKNELKEYYKDYLNDTRIDNTRVYGAYSGFKKEKFQLQEINNNLKAKSETRETWLDFKEQHSIFDDIFKDCYAQYANFEKETETPRKSWDQVNTKLKDLDTHKLHYVKRDQQYIEVDFDKKDSEGNKSFDENRKIASKFPETYGELSKSGQGIHLTYFYEGDVSRLSRVYSDEIEIKVFTGNSSLRRRLTKCNDIPIATLHEGDLPLKEEKGKMVDWDGIKDQQMLERMVIKNLNREYHSNTKPSVDYINYLLNNAYDSGVDYNLDRLKPDVLAFCNQSTHQAKQCLDIFSKMKFHSKKYDTIDIEENSMPIDKAKLLKYEVYPIAFFDVEVFKNLFVLVYKEENKDCISLINPSVEAVKEIVDSYRLVGFNCRKYDNHILHAWIMGFNNLELYNLSQDMIAYKTGFFAHAYNYSYTDIYDYAKEKQSLKKWEIDLGIHHQENEYPWDEPVPEDKWNEIVDYCKNDVIATEAVWNKTKGDFEARKILVKIANLMDSKDISTVNDKTNTLTKRIIFQGEKNPQKEFIYTDLSTGMGSDGVYREWNHFPGYKFDHGKSTYFINNRLEPITEGGQIYVEPGMYENVLLDDVQSMHPHSILALELFGPRYTNNFKEILDARLFIKQGNFKKARELLNGALSQIVPDNTSKEQAKSISNALKLAINSVYGLTSAKFDNEFKDPRNVDNIVAKRGALFMMRLKAEVENKGFTVAHIKTDSIKVPNYTLELKQFISDYGHKFGYDFDAEAVFEKFCIINQSTYICKVKEGSENGAGPGEWSGTGTQFNKKTNPYVFKTLFSHEPIEFKDFCETKQVQTALYLDFNDGMPDDSEVSKILALRRKIKDDPLFSEKSMTKKEAKLFADYADKSDEELMDILASCHNYKFVGRVGSFTPVKKEAHGGLLMRKDDRNVTGYSSVTGTKGFYWMESEMVKLLNIENLIDKSYYIQLVDDAVSEISKYGDFEWFVGNDDSKLSIYSNIETF